MVTTGPVFLFPGSTNDPSPGLLRGLAESDREVADVVEQCDKAAAEFGRPAVSARVLGDDPSPSDPRPEDRHAAQLAISASVFALRIRSGAQPRALVGHSLGELWALCCAGAVSVLDAARLVYLRGNVLRGQARPGGMAALGVGQQRAGHLVAMIDAPWLSMACVNAPRQSVLSGDTDLLSLAGSVAERLGWSFRMLDAPYPYHSPGMAAAATEFRRIAAEFTFDRLQLPVYSPILGRYFHESDDPADALGGALVRSVDFAGAVRYLHSAGVDNFVECGFGEVLSKCARATAPNVETSSGLALASVGAGSVLGTRPEPAVGSRARVLTELARIYAERLGYPVEELLESADLEADLGVDSLKQTELLGSIGRRFGIGRFGDAVRLLDYPTLGHIADAVWQDSGDRIGRGAN